MQSVVMHSLGRCQAAVVMQPLSCSIGGLMSKNVIFVDNKLILNYRLNNCRINKDHQALAYLDVGNGRSLTDCGDEMCWCLL